MRFFQPLLLAVVLAFSTPASADAIADAEAALAAGDLTAAKTLVAPLVAGNDARGLFIMAEIVARDPAQAKAATDLYRRAAVLGHADAALTLATRAFKGEGMDPNPTDTKDLLQGLADQRYGKAELLLAQMYLSGDLTAESDVAIALLNRAFEDGEPEAAYLLGTYSLAGTWVPADPETAFSWFDSAAARGHAGAAEKLADAYRTGTGTAIDPEAAARWYDVAAKAGKPMAQFQLAELYAQGSGVARDLFAAADLYRAAAAQSNPEAMLALGHLYAKGQIGIRDRVEAYAWYRRAGLLGLDPANVAARELAGKMKKADIDKAEAMALEGYSPN